MKDRAQRRQLLKKFEKKAKEKAEILLSGILNKDKETKKKWIEHFAKIHRNTRVTCSCYMCQKWKDYSKNKKQKSEEEKTFVELEDLNKDNLDV
jgi:GT2 family glycosyltransferase